MGADGWLVLLRADVVDAHGYYPRLDFNNVYERHLGNVRIYTYYTDDIGLPSHPSTRQHNHNDYEKIGAYITTWDVWT